MRIYIDESGSFVPGSAQSKVCCQAALVVPERFAPELLGKYESLRASWTSEPEVKGSSLNDGQTAAALDLLRGHGVIAEICTLDVLHHSVGQVKLFQAEMAASFARGITPAHNANAKQFVENLTSELMALSPQLFLQVRILIGLMEELLHVVPPYYAQRLPTELGRWDWVVDPKDVVRTRFEEVWTKAVSPLLQTISLGRPAARVEGFDYSAFNRFTAPPPPYLAALIPDRESRPNGIDIGLLLSESVAFPNSASEPGLQLVDIVASAFTKAMNGKLPEDVWRRLGPLLVQKPKGELPVRMVALGPGPDLKAEGHHKRVLLGLRSRARKMFAG